MMAGRSMTRDEAMLILNLKEPEEGAEGDDTEIDPKEVMERFDTLIEKN